MTRDTQALFAKWFLGKFLDWQKSEGGLKTGADFAVHLGVSQPAVSKWLRGEGYPQRLPYIRQLSEKLGVEIYDVLGLERPEMQRPDPHVTRMVNWFTSLSGDAQKKAEARYVGAIAWETEVWVADAPTHLIHFNGPRYLGPYHPPGA